MLFDPGLEKRNVPTSLCREPLKTQRTGVTSVTLCFSVCWPKVQYIIKYVKYVTKTCENLFVQIQWFNCDIVVLNM